MNKARQYDEKKLRRVIRTNRWVVWTARHWLILVLAFLLLYTGLSLLPPVFMHAGLEGPANVIYTIYGPMCHQFAFRSWFFFGDQLVYPREAAGSGLPSFESYAARDPHFAGLNLYEWTPDLQFKARSFKGNEEMGYKTALCERDVMIYGAMLLAGLLFARVRRWLRPVPLWLYFMLGIVPLGLDGFSQMFSYPPFEFWPIRETLPVFRVLTGALFGVMNAWLAFPYLEESMQSAVDATSQKLEYAERYLAMKTASD